MPGDVTANGAKYLCLVVDVEKYLQFRRPGGGQCRLATMHSFFKVYLRWRIYVFVSLRDLWVHMDLDQAMKLCDEKV